MFGATANSGHLRASRAFSLVELTLVLAIGSVLVAIATPRYLGATERYEADAAVRRIAADLRFAATRARMTSTKVTVKFEKNVDKNWYQIVDYFDPDHPDQEYTVYLSRSPYGVSLFEAPGDLEFDEYGMPNKSATIAVRAGPSGLGSVRTVSTNELTGEVTIP